MTTLDTEHTISVIKQLNNGSVFSITITQNVQNVAPSHGHRHEVANTITAIACIASSMTLAPGCSAHVNQLLLQFVAVLHFHFVNLNGCR